MNTIACRTIEYHDDDDNDDYKLYDYECDYFTSTMKRR